MSHTLLRKYDSKRYMELGNLPRNKFIAKFNLLDLDTKDYYSNGTFSLSFKTEEEVVKFAMMYS